MEYFKNNMDAHPDSPPLGSVLTCTVVKASQVLLMRRETVEDELDSDQGASHSFLLETSECLFGHSTDRWHQLSDRETSPLVWNERS